MEEKPEEQPEEQPEQPEQPENGQQTATPFQFDPITLQPLSPARVHSYYDLPHPTVNPYIDAVMGMILGKPQVRDINSPYGARTSRSHTPLYLPVTSYEPGVAGVSKGKAAAIREDPFALMRNLLIGKDPYVPHGEPFSSNSQIYSKTVGESIVPKSDASFNIINIISRKTGLPVEDIYGTIEDYVESGHTLVRGVRKAMQNLRDGYWSNSKAKNALDLTERLAKLIEASPPYQGTLYRRESARLGGVPDSILKEQFKVGGQFEAPVLSFSTKTTASLEHHSEGHLPALYVLEPGSKSLPIKGLSDYSSELEVISGGRFVITGIEKMGKLKVIRIRQIEPPKLMTPKGYENLRPSYR